MYLFVKRFLDIVLSLIALCLVLPIVLFVGLILTIDFKSSPLFIQARPGKNEKIFHVLKFKTMNNKKDAHGNLLPDTDRLTPLGIFIRKTSIDELPQLINVLKGDMSLIGPRPLLVRYLPYFTKEERLRFSVRPGITGLAQISGRNFMTWDEKFQKDIYYVKNMGLSLDTEIFYKTLVKVLKSDGIEVDQSASPFITDMDVERSYMDSPEKS